MGERLKLKVELTKADKAVEVTGWLLVFAVWGMTITSYQRLPDSIPTHYNGAGVADGFGDKWMILTLPLIATVLFVGLTILNRFPHLFNYPANLTAGNALGHYTNATRMIRYLKTIIVFIFGLISYQTMRHANGQTDGLGAWFLPLILGLIFVPILYFLTKASQSKK